MDTNVLVSALRSKRGASYKLLSMIDSGRFQITISVPLLFEYEDVLKRKSLNIALTHNDIDDILDYLCAVADKREIYYLWRPFLKDPKDDMVLELSVESGSDYIVTYNIDDFKGIERFNVRAIKPKDFLKLIGEGKWALSV
ncbi:MAG TPA: putative toxin-antitoxin system toxin component, PIN family [Thermodesulfobacteriota bacterium]|nr:putative toxin-antitoxin system toxin component, PIN family [Thermodesulfobacteriota bacterium]